MTQLPSSRPRALEIREGVVVEDENLWMWQLFEGFKKNLTTITDPLFSYLAKYSQYKDFLLMDVAKELERVQKDQTKEIKEIKEEIEVNKRRETEIKQEIIERIQVGMFDIDTKEICDYMAGKYRRIALGLIQIISKRVIAATNQHLEGFR